MTESTAAIDLNPFQRKLESTPSEPITLPRLGGIHLVDTSVIEGVYYPPLSSNIREFASFTALKASSPNGTQLLSFQQCDYSTLNSRTSSFSGPRN